MSRVTLCGSDVSLMYKGRLGDCTLDQPIGIGHEASGVVVRCGASVRHLLPGDRVALEPGGPCRRCHLCTSGRYNNCSIVSFHASPVPNPGFLGRYFKHQADLCFKLPESVSQEEGALMEPLAVAIHSCNRARVKLGSSVLICGAGAIGLFCLLTAKAMGATKVLMTDVREDRLVRAKAMGAHHTLLVDGGSDAKTQAKKVEEVMGCMPEATLECSGVQSSAALSIYATRTCGTVVLVGIGAEEATLPIFNAAIREVDIRGVYRYRNYYPTAIDMVAKGLINVRPLITHRFKFEEVQKAYETLRDSEAGAIKCVISCE